MELQPSQWVVDTCITLGYIIFIIVCLSFAFLLAMVIIASIRREIKQRDFLVSLPQEQQDIINKYVRIRVPLFPWVKDKKNDEN